MFTHCGNGHGPLSYYDSQRFVHATTMRVAGLRVARNGHLRRYYDGNVLVAAYSYDTCIFALLRIGAAETRAVFNLTRYSMTTGRHQAEVVFEVTGVYEWLCFSCDEQSTLAARRAIDFYDLGTCIFHDELLNRARRRIGAESEAV